MRELKSAEITLVAGGVDSLFGITQLARGFTLTGLIGAATTAYGFGYGLGTLFNYRWELATGNSPGISLYNFWHNE